jgi:hypothetical protein
VVGGRRGSNAWLSDVVEAATRWSGRRRGQGGVWARRREVRGTTARALLDLFRGGLGRVGRTREQVEEGRWGGGGFFAKWP